MAEPTHNTKHETRNSDTLLRIADLSCRRGERLLFRGLDLTLAAGEAVQVAGANGRGKTTLLRTVCGLQRPETGTVHWRGHDIRRDPDAFAGNCLYLAHENALNPDLTARENLAALTRVMGDRSDAAAIDEALADMGATAWADLPCRSLSAGQRRRSALARLRLSRAPLWLLDEPAAALDADARGLLAECIGDHVGAGGSVLFTTHEPLTLPGIELRIVELPA